MSPSRKKHRQSNASISAETAFFERRRRRYLGVDHGWRTLDTALAVVMIARYLGLAAARVLERSAAHALALPPFLISLACFVRSQRATTFRKRAGLHARWHFWLQAALLALLRAEGARGAEGPR